MGTTTQRTTHTVSNIWTDAVSSIAGAANVGGFVKNLSSYTVEIIKGGSVAPTSNAAGIPVLPYGEEWCETDHIWVRGTGTIAFDVLS